LRQAYDPPAHFLDRATTPGLKALRGEFTVRGE
jgi:hypothetical protein